MIFVDLNGKETEFTDIKEVYANVDDRQRSDINSLRDLDGKIYLVNDNFHYKTYDDKTIEAPLLVGIIHDKNDDYAVTTFPKEHDDVIDFPFCLLTLPLAEATNVAKQLQGASDTTKFDEIVNNAETGRKAEKTTEEPTLETTSHDDLFAEPHTQTSAGFSAHFLPYKDLDGKEQIFLVFADADKKSPTTQFDNIPKFSIQDVSTTKIDGKDIIQLRGLATLTDEKGVVTSIEDKTICLPIDAKENKEFFANLQKIKDKEAVEFTPVADYYKALNEISNLPKAMSNEEIETIVAKDTATTKPPVVEEENAEETVIPPVVEEEAETKETSSLGKDKIATSSKAQSLEKATFEFDGKKLSGLSQTIETGKLGLSEKQKLTLLESGKSNVLVAIEHPDKKAPVAVFSQNGDKIELSLSKEFVDEFKTNNPDVVLPDGKEKEGYVSYDVEKLKLDENLNIEDIQVKSAGEDFAVMFSALGCQIKDKEGHLGVHKNESKPFNVAVSTNFLENAYSNEKGCEIEKKDPAQSALLIASLQMARQKELRKRPENRKEPVVVEYGYGNNKTQLISVPIKVKNDGLSGTQYLNIRKEIVKGKEKTYVYMHLTGEKNKRATAPKFWEINEASLEATKLVDGKLESPSLYLGLTAGRNVARANLMMDLEDPTNIEALSFLGDTADGFIRPKFDKTPHVADNDVEALTKTKIKDTEFNVYSRPAESSATIKSLSGIAELSRRTVKEETIAEPAPTTAPSAGIVPPPPENDAEETNEPTETPPPAEAPSAEPPKPPENLQKKKKAKDADTIKKQIDGATKILTGLGFLCVLCSALLPGLNAVAMAFFITAAVINTKPWRIITIPAKGIAKLVKKIKNRDRTKTKVKNKRLHKKLDAYKSIEKQNKQKLDYAKWQRQQILDSNLPEKYKKKQLKKMDKEIEALERNAHAIEYATQVVNGKLEAKGLKREARKVGRTAMTKNVKDVAKTFMENISLDKMEGKKDKLLSKKDTLSKEKADLEELKDLLIQERIDELNGKEEKTLTAKEKDELAELKGLMSKEEKSLTESEKARMEKLLKKYDAYNIKGLGASIRNVLSRIKAKENDIENYQKEIESFDVSIQEKEQEIEEARQERRADLDDTIDKKQEIKNEAKKVVRDSKQADLESFTLEGLDETEKQELFDYQKEQSEKEEREREEKEKNKILEKRQKREEGRTLHDNLMKDYRKETHERERK